MRDIAFGIIICLLFILLIVLFCAILIKLYIQKIKKYNQILFQKEIEYQIQLNQSILEAQEQTFQNISQELHDDAGQQITYINFQLENLKLDYPEVLTKIEPVSQSVTNLSASIRQLSHSLSNQLLSQQNLLKAIKTEAERLNNNRAIAIKYSNFCNQKIEFSTHEKIVVYRIFQECMNNIFKHSKANEVNIVLKNNPNFSVVIEDNGKGFDFEKEIKSMKSNGLQNIISRAQVINYKIEIHSEINKGTKIVLQKLDD